MTCILLVKLGPIGDVVMATPVLEAAHRLMPGAQVTWVVTASLAPLLARLRPIPRIVTVDDAALWHGSIWQRLRLLARLRRQLVGEHFDLGLFGHANRRPRPRPGIVCWFLFHGSQSIAGISQREFRQHQFNQRRFRQRVSFQCQPGHLVR